MSNRAVFPPPDELDSLDIPSAALAEVVRLLNIAAAGREEYASGLSADDQNPALREMYSVLTTSAATFRQAARIAAGDLSILYSVLPSWRWNDVPLPELESDHDR